MSRLPRGVKWSPQPDWIRTHPTLTDTQRKVYQALRQAATPGDEISISWSALAAEVKVTRRTIHTALDALEAAGAIRVVAERRGTIPARYQVYHSPFNVVKEAPQQPLIVVPEPEPEKVWQRPELPVYKSVADSLRGGASGEASFTTRRL